MEVEIVWPPLRRHENHFSLILILHLPVSSRVWGCEENLYFELLLKPTVTRTNSANQVNVGHALDQSRNVQSRGPDRAHQKNVTAIVEGKLLNFETIFKGLSGCNLNGFFDTDLHSVRPNGLVGYKVPTDPVNISVKEAIHMGFNHKISL